MIQTVRAVCDGVEVGSNDGGSALPPRTRRDSVETTCDFCVEKPLRAPSCLNLETPTLLFTTTPRPSLSGSVSPTGRHSRYISSSCMLISISLYPRSPARPRSSQRKAKASSSSRRPPRMSCSPQDSYLSSKAVLTCSYIVCDLSTCPARNVVDHIDAVGYTVVAFNQTVHRKIDPKSHVNTLDPLLSQLRKRPGVAYVKRLTIVLDEESEKGFGLVSTFCPVTLSY